MNKLNKHLQLDIIMTVKIFTNVENQLIKLTCDFILKQKFITTSFGTVFGILVHGKLLETST